MVKEKKEKKEKESSFEKEKKERESGFKYSKEKAQESRKYSQNIKQLKGKEKFVKERFKKEGKSQKDLDNALETLKRLRNEKNLARLGRSATQIKSLAGAGYGSLAHGTLVSERIGSAIQRALKAKLLRKPSINLIKPISSSELIKQFSRSNYSMFSREPKSYQETPNQNNRSLFFKQNWEELKEKEGFRVL